MEWRFISHGQSDISCDASEIGIKYLSGFIKCLKTLNFWKCRTLEFVARC